MHLTMKFYEDITEDYSRKICNYIKEMKYNGFEARFKGVDCFPGRGKCRVFILTSDSDNIKKSGRISQMDWVKTGKKEE